MDTKSPIANVENEEGGLTRLNIHDLQEQFIHNNNTNDDDHNIVQEQENRTGMAFGDYSSDTNRDDMYPPPSPQNFRAIDSHYDNDDIYLLNNTPPQSLSAKTSFVYPLPNTNLVDGLPPPPSSIIDQRNGLAEETSIKPNSSVVVSSCDIESVASSSEGHNLNLSHTRGGGLHRQPAIYSAIGSLEDPLSTSFKRWENDSHTSNLSGGTNAKMEKNRKSNYEFPSMTTTLLAPTSHVAAARKKRNLLETSVRKQSRESDEVFLKQPPGKMQSKQHNGKQALQPEGTTSNLVNAPKGDHKHMPVAESKTKTEKKVTMNPRTNGTNTVKTKSRRSSSRKQSNQNRNPTEMFRPSSDAYTPRMGKKEIKYKPAAMRTPVQQMASPLGTLSRPNFRDALRRVAMIIHQHIVKIERRFEHHRPINRSDSLTTTASNPPDSTASTSAGGRGYRHRNHGYASDDGLFSTIMRETFSEDRYIIPRYKCTMVRVPMAFPGMVCGLKQIREVYEIPTENEIYEFAHQLFKSVQLSSECSIVGLIYVERLMEVAKVPLLAETWRPIFMCGLLMASKVWQDLSSWNIEFAGVYPCYALESINRLEVQFLRMIKWDLYISSSQYAKYYFALRSLVEKPDFRQRYNRLVGGVDMVQASQARKIEQRSTMVKEEAMLHLSTSM